MVELGERTYKRIRETVEAVGAQISSKANAEWDEDACDICGQHTRHMLSCHECREEGWLFCEHHGRKLGVLW